MFDTVDGDLGDENVVGSYICEYVIPEEQR